MSDFIRQPLANEGESDIRSFATANKLSYYTGEPLAQRHFRVDDYYQLPGTIGNENFGNTQLEGGDGNKKTYKKDVNDEIPSSIVDDLKDNTSTNHTVGGSLNSFPREGSRTTTSSSYRPAYNGPVMTSGREKLTAKDEDELVSREFRKENPEAQADHHDYYYSIQEQVNKPTDSAGLSGDTSTETTSFKSNSKFDKDLSTQITGGGGKNAQPLSVNMDITNQVYYAESTGEVKKTQKLGVSKDGGHGALETANANQENVKLL